MVRQWHGQWIWAEIHSARVHFAKTGDPGWPAWISERPVMTFDFPQSRVVNSAREDERSSWD
jgi:para-nitrobenzyl esterase